MLKLSEKEIEAVVLSASPTRLVVITYDAAITCLETSIEMIDTGNIEGRYHAIERAMNMITELYMSLDHEQGGEIASNLSCLYTFLLARLPRVNFYNDKQTAADAIAILSQLRDSWIELDNSYNEDPSKYAECMGETATATTEAAAAL
jgi:flagellar protein FliS